MKKVKVKIDGVKEELNLEDAEACLIITLQELTHAIRMGYNL